MDKQILLGLLVFLTGFSFAILGCYLAGVDFSTRNFGLGMSYFISTLIGLAILCFYKAEGEM
jgi:hypothetical protein